MLAPFIPTSSAFRRFPLTIMSFSIQLVTRVTSPFYREGFSTTTPTILQCRKSISIISISAFTSKITTSPRFTRPWMSGFPQTRKVEPSELSSFQRKSFQRDGKSFPQNTRLISSCDRQVIGEWLDNAFLSSLLLFGKIGTIVTIVRCKAFPIFREYIEKLNKARGEEPSKLVGSIYKALSNTLAGHVCLGSAPSFSLPSQLDCAIHFFSLLYRQISSRYFPTTPPANCHGRKEVRKTDRFRFLFRRHTPRSVHEYEKRPIPFRK